MRAQPLAIASAATARAAVPKRESLGGIRDILPIDAQSGPHRRGRAADCRLHRRPDASICAEAVPTQAWRATAWKARTPVSLLRRLFPERDQRARYLPLYNAVVAEARD